MASLGICVVAILFHLPTIVATRVVVVVSSGGVNGTSSLKSGSAVGDVSENVESTLCYNGIQTFGTVNAVLFRVANRMLDCVIPVALMCYFYRRMSASMKTNSALLLAVTTTTNSTKSQHRNRVALWTLKNLILVYVFCVFPGRLLVLMQLAITQFVLGADMSRQNASLFSFIHLLLGMLYMSNNGVHVMVYARLVQGFRRFLKQLFTCGYLRSRLQRPCRSRCCCYCVSGGSGQSSGFMLRQLRMKLVVNKRRVAEE